MLFDKYTYDHICAFPQKYECHRCLLREYNYIFI